MNDELKFNSDYSVWGSSNYSPGDLPVSGKVGMCIGSAFSMLLFRFRTQVGLKRAMAH